MRRACSIDNSAPWYHNVLSLQEKQFVAAMNVSNLKYKTGKHCSARWRAMDAEEKKLYATLEQTGSK